MDELQIAKEALKEIAHLLKEYEGTIGPENDAYETASTTLDELEA